MSGSRKKYTSVYREQAVRLVVDTGHPIVHIAANRLVSENNCSGRWIAAANACSPNRRSRGAQ